MSKIYIYHHNDHDGIIAAGIVYNFIYPVYRDTEFIFNMIDYTDKLNFDHIDLDHDYVMFLDYSFSNKDNLVEFEKLLKRRKESDDIIWIDHHKTSIGLLDNYNIKGIRKEGLCGTVLTYAYFCRHDLLNEFKNLHDNEASDKFHKDENIPYFLKLIDDYDCWKHIYCETNNFHYGLTISDPTDLQIHMLLKDKKDWYISNIISKGEDIQKYLNFENQQYHVKMYGFEYTLPEEHGGYRCFCLNRKGNSIMFGNKINEYDAVIPFYYVNGKWKYSIFTNKDNVDCEGVAKSYGGGGHPKAAGWTTDELIFK